ncbi:MAG: TetR/AcrR family transcriptional regulator [Actinomycetota bacterium]|nr:TetR/AcrR family transcriptional regulator [Actinomycetota bacterium]
MSPKPPDPQVRTALIDAAARLLIQEGPGALTTRRLAREVGTSTMAVYTYFRGMEELKHELRREGFARLAALQDALPHSDDVVAEVVAQGIAYFTNALANSHLYRFMFMEPIEEGEAEVGIETFERLVRSVQRAVEAGRFQGDPWRLATQLWAMSHGVISLEMSGCLTIEEAIQVATDSATNLLVAFGEDRAVAERLIAEATGAFAAANAEPLEAVRSST